VPSDALRVRRSDRGRSKHLALIEELLHEQMAIVAATKDIYDDVGVQQERHYLYRNCFLKRASDSRRSFFTQAADPFLSSGWSLSFQLPAASRSASF
jgi:hypothetical protein